MIRCYDQRRSRAAHAAPHQWRVVAGVLAVLVGVLSPGVAPAAVPAGFQDVLVASGVGAPAVLAPAPDGRLFVGEKATGRIRIVKNGALLAAAFLDLNDYVPAGTYFDSYFERGLLGVTFDPAFATTQFVYVYYTLCKQPGSPPQPGTNTCQKAVNRIVRFRANGDVVAPASATTILDDIGSDAGNHNGGWIAFGPADGMLYAAVGDGGATSTKAQDLKSLNGKVLRLNGDGSVPADNPFVGQAANRGEIWALGFRNPFRCRFRADGRLLCADVGQDTWEEIDVVFRGANYGWPTTEGPFTLASYPSFTPPIHSYAHDGAQASIIGGDFGARTAFPGDHQQSYYFADFARGFIKRAILDASGTAVQSVVDFATGLGGNTLTDVVAASDGALYYTSYAGNAVRKIVAVSGNRAPIAKATATPASGRPPLTVSFSSAGSSDPDGDPLSFQWDFGDGTAPSTAANATHAYQSAGSYTATLTVSDGKAIPGPATDRLTIVVGTPPVVTIDSPQDGATFRAGETITLTGRATDAEDGTVPASSLHWQVIFHHDDHVHPFIDDLAGSPRSFATATAGESAADVAYEIVLRATDATGLTTTRSVVLVPETADFTLVTSPPGLQVTLDGQTRTTPVTVTGVVGFSRTLGAPSPQTSNGKQYAFASWSDGGAQTHTFTTAATATTYSASFNAIVPTATAVRSATPTPALTGTPAPTATRTITPQPTPTRTATPVAAPTRTATPLAAATATRTSTPLPQATPSRTATPAPNATAGESELTALGAVIARVSAPTGGGNRALEVVRDGDVPPVGTKNSKRQYDTYDGEDKAKDDWIGYSYSAAQTFSRVAFTEGMHFPNGGWFELLTVQVRQGGVWSDAPAIRSAPAYHAWDDGVGFETYMLTFTPVSGDGIRLSGRPGGSAGFISVGELRVFGPASAQPNGPACIVPPSLDQSRRNGDYFRQLASDNSVVNSDRQRVRSPAATTICAVTAYFWNAGPTNGAALTTGRFHLEIWSDAGGVPGVQIGGGSSTIDAASVPSVQGDAPAQTVVWPATARPRPSGDFWIVVRSDSLSNDQLAWSAVRYDSNAHVDAAYNAFKANKNLGTDFNFRVSVEP